MSHSNGRVKEIRMDASGHSEVSIVCPDEAIPLPGQYLLAFDPSDKHALLSTPLFRVETTAHGFWANPLLPVSWRPSAILELAGPIGHGFNLPKNIQRLGLVACGETVARLLPLIHPVSQSQVAAMTLFTDLSIPRLPSALEVSPLTSLPDALDWPDYLVMDVPLAQVEHLRYILRLSEEAILPCPAQVLVITPMPCAGLGKCGACAIQTRRGWKLVCEDGPVFELKTLKW